MNPMINPPRQHVRSFTGMLQDVNAVAVVSRLKKNQGPSPEEIAEAAREEARKHGKIEGYMEGLSTGRREGLELGRKEAFEQVYREESERSKQQILELMSVLAQHVAEVNAEIPGWFAEAEQAMTDRTMEIVRRILSAELLLTREHALEIVKDALSEVTHSDHVRVRMNPFDAVIVSQHRDELMSVAPQLRDIAFVDDPSIEGGCILESDGGIVDARLTTKLQMLEGDLAA